MNIIVDYDSMIKNGKNIINSAEDMQELINKFRQRVEEVPNVWQGEVAQKYVEGIDSHHINELMKIQDMILDYGNYLVNAAESYKVLDETFCSKKIM